MIITKFTRFHIIIRGVNDMKSCEFVTFISGLACTIARDKTDEEISVLAAFFTQLRRYINNNICF